MAREDAYFKYALVPGTYDAVVNGELKTNCQSRIVFVPSEADLADLPEYAPGMLAATYGMDTVWQLDDTGNWIEI